MGTSPLALAVALALHAIRGLATGLRSVGMGVRAASLRSIGRLIGQNIELRTDLVQLESRNAQRSHRLDARRLGHASTRGAVAVC